MSLRLSPGGKACLALLEATALEAALCGMQVPGGLPFASSSFRACKEICSVTSEPPWGGVWRQGSKPVECGSAHPEEAGSWVGLNEAWAVRARLDRREAAEGPSGPPIGRRDSSAGPIASYRQGGSCHGSRAPDLAPQDHPVWGNSDSSYLVALATCPLEDPQAPTASSEAVC